ncbi:MAG: preprotein translocase subunit SecD [Halobacteria archaeon]|nr:preprotein translocase subunit SecD [Halobacteria archaeon]
MSDLKGLLKDWRVVLLIVVMVLSVVAIAPTGDTEGTTSLKFGLQLDGGTRMQLEPVGTTAQVSGLGDTDPAELQSELTQSLGVRTKVYSNDGIVEIRGNATDAEIRTALESHGLTVESIDEGVTPATLEELRNSLQTRIENTPQVGQLSGVRVFQQSNPITNQNFIVVELPGIQENASSIIAQQGRFEIRVVEQGNQTRHVLFGDAVERGSVSRPRPSQQGGDTYSVAFSLTDSGVEQFRSTVIDVNATTNPSAHPLVMYFNDDEVFRGPLNPTLASDIESGRWQGGGLQVTGMTEQQAQRVSVSLRSGALPTQVEIASSTSISASQGSRFKTYSLLIGIFAVIVVGATIYWRYRDLRVAVPMALTGLAEVVALLGFAAGFGLSLDLSHIAGLIAVIGTGVDDLVIITDEVLHEGGVSSSNLYKKRIKKAFIIIGMAAATTIGAMLPLAFLGLGRLTGFAIVTIVGVLIGILITRPAYGSILRVLVTEK